MQHFMYKNSSIIACVFIFIFACSPQQNSKPFIENPEPIDSLINHYVDNKSFPLLYMRIENKVGEVMYEHQAVNDSLLPDTKVHGDSWFRIWSMSKIITISLVLDLVEDGLLRLDDPVVQYLPEFSGVKIAVNAAGKPLGDVVKAYFDQGNPEAGPFENNPTLSKENCPWALMDNPAVMTVEDLINHQAGFYYATTPFECLNAQIDAMDINRLKSTDAILKAMAKLPLIVVPGETNFYGLNTTVLGFVAERASGKSLNELLEERIKTPLKIKGLRYKKTDNNKLLPTFSAKEGTLRFANDGELDIMGAHTIDYSPESETYLGGEGMLGTANGYADFLRMLMNHGTLNGHRFLEEATVKQMYAPHTQMDNEWGYNGYNLWVTGPKDREMGFGDEGLWRGGGYEQTHFWIDPKRDFVAVIMSQMFGVPPRGHNRDNTIRGAIYKQIFAQENKK